jgi:hypothetical protein
MLIVSVVCLLFPKAVQSAAVRAVQMGVTSRSEFLVAYVSSKQYLFVVRAVGLIALANLVFLSMAGLEGR